MRLDPGVLGQPAHHFGMFMRAVIVHDQMQFQRFRVFGVQLFEEFEKFLMAVAVIALAHDFAPGHFQRRKQRGGAVSHIVMRPVSAPPRLERQARLCAVQSSGSGSFRPRTARPHSGADSNKPPPHPAAWAQIPGRAKA